MDGEGIMRTQDSCYGGGSLAGAVIGTFLTTILLLAVAALLYRQWRRHKGKHLVLVTNPEIVEDAYAFDNPCFKDATPAVGRNHETRPLSSASLVIETSPMTKDSPRWSSPWSSLGLTSVNKNDRRRTLDDSCLGSKATRVSVVSLRSRDFTGLGFNVCGNMREGIFVKDLLHRGPASESGRIQPGDRIGSVKISFRSMVYEDALTILSYASPYDVELEVENGGSCTAGSRPTTLLKKTVGPSPSRICHPLYRSQSIPELSQANKTSSKRLFTADPNESIGSNYSTMNNSTIKSSKSTPGSHTLERRHEDAKMLNNHHNHHNNSHNNHHHQHQNHQKFGIKVLPALEDTVHRIENQNEHNTNLERKNSRKFDYDNVTYDDTLVSSVAKKDMINLKKINDDELRFAITERNHKRETFGQSDEKFDEFSTKNSAIYNRPLKVKTIQTSNETKDKIVSMETSVLPDNIINIPSEVPTEVHNAAMAARRNRKSSGEFLNIARSMNIDICENNDLKSPQRNKRKAPAPPIITGENISETTSVVFDSDKNDNVTSSLTSSLRKNEREKLNDSIDSITDYAESLGNYVEKLRESTNQRENNDDEKIRDNRLNEIKKNRDNNETDSDNDSEIHDSFTTIELKPADITIHHTPVPTLMARKIKDKERDDDDDEEEEEENDDYSSETNDVYRKAASLGDLSKYENKSLATLERAQSLDMADTVTKKRKIANTPDEINESIEDLTKFENNDYFDCRKLKKSNEWGTLEDAIWKKSIVKNDCTIDEKQKSKIRELDGINLERSRSADEMKLYKNNNDTVNNVDVKFERSIVDIEMIDKDTSLELYNLPLSILKTDEFIKNERIFNPDEDNSLARIVNNGRIVKSPTPMETEIDFCKTTISPVDVKTTSKSMISRPYEITKISKDDKFNEAIDYFDREISETLRDDKNLTETMKTDNREESRKDLFYAGRKEIKEEPVRRIKIITGCPGCEDKFSNQSHDCTRNRLHGEKTVTRNIIDDEAETLDWKPQEIGKLPNSPSFNDEKVAISSSSMSAFKIGLTKFEKSLEIGEREKSPLPTESRIEKKLLRERGIDIDDNDNREDSENYDSIGTRIIEETGNKRLDDLDTEEERKIKLKKKQKKKMENEENESDESYKFEGEIKLKRENLSSNDDESRNISNVSVSSGENSENSGNVNESYEHESKESRPPLPVTPMPSSVTTKKLTYITEINVETSREKLRDRESDNVDDDDNFSTKRDIASDKLMKNNEIINKSTSRHNGKTINSSKKPPVPPRRNEASKFATRDNDTSEKQLIYVSEYKTGSRGDNSEKISETIAGTRDKMADVRSESREKFENWIYLDDNKDQNPWGSSEQQQKQQQVKNIVVNATACSAIDDEKIIHQ